MTVGSGPDPARVSPDKGISVRHVDPTNSHSGLTAITTRDAWVLTAPHTTNAP